MTNTPLNPDALKAALEWFANAVGEVEVKHADNGTRPGDYWNGYRAAKNEIADLLAEPKLIKKATEVALAVAQPVVNSVEELDALPHGTVIMATGGQPNPDYPELFLKAGYEWSPWQALDPSDRDDGENMESSGSVLKWRCDGEARVLYRPAVNDA